MSSILIKNAEIITMNRNEEILQGDIYIVDDRIIDIGLNLPYSANKVIDANG